MTTPAPIRVLHWNWAVYRRIWKSNLLTAFVQPILYLLAMGVGVGSLVNSNTGSGQILGGVTYIAFVAPGLLATTAMMVGSVESMWPLMDAVVWGRQFEAMAATPIEARDIVSAHALWMIFRTGVAAATVALVMALFPEVRSWGLIAAVPAAVLSGLALAMPLAAFTITRTRDMAFPVIQRFVLVPLFLFGGAFFPLSQLPAFVRYIAYAAPLWHGVELCRGFASGTALSVGAALGHIGYLVALTVVGALVFARNAKRRLFA